MKLVSSKNNQTVFYIRSNDRESLNSQNLKGEKYARQNSLSFSFIVDAKTSGLKPFSERPGMRKILQMVEDGIVETVIVDSLNRISRDVEQLLYFIEFLSKYHTKLVLLDGGFKNACK
ncbi:recombinase family protein [Neobacillus drentensis]|uniref:recombinase family protein n=1 Tax=Neobacillus drentensis TaxID=220684 RepID=UPI00300003FA